jgi:hypothetical protein
MSRAARALLALSEPLSWRLAPTEPYFAFAALGVGHLTERTPPDDPTAMLGR